MDPIIQIVGIDLFRRDHQQYIQFTVKRNGEILVCTLSPGNLYHLLESRLRPAGGI